MAEEVITDTVSASPEPLDHKRKLADLDHETSEKSPNGKNEESVVAENSDVVVSDESEAKRPRVDETPDGIASENGHQGNEVEEPVKEAEQPSEEDSEQPASLEAPETESSEQPASMEVPETDNTEQPVSMEAPETENTERLASVEVPETQNTELPTVKLHVASDAQDSAAETSLEDKPKEPEESQQPEMDAQPQQEDVSIDDSYAELNLPSHGTETTTQRIEVPNSKVGVLIGKAGDTIRFLQYNSGAKIQIMRDADTDPGRLTRPVEIIGSLENIKKAEELINAVIAEADAGGSPSLIARGLSSSHAVATAEQIQIQVPNEKVGLIIGRGGETIKSLQTRSGARIQLIPQNLPEGDESKERTIRVTGDKKQIDTATDMIKEVMNQISIMPFPWGRHCSLGVAIDNYYSLPSTEERYQALSLAIAGCY